MRQWAKSVTGAKERVAVPIMTHPGIDLIGKKVIDAVTDGDVHARAIVALSEKYPSAAATVIMDLTVEAEAFGSELVFAEHEVPSVTGRLVGSYDQVQALKVPELTAGRVGEYIKANAATASAITDKPVFSGCIGPFSLAGRLYDMTEIMMSIYTEPATAELLLDKCAEFITKYIKALKETGVNGIIIAEPAAGLLSNEDAMNYSTRYLKKIIAEVQDDTFMVVLHNCGNGGHCTESMVASGAMALHFGNKIDMAAAAAEVPADILVMGNLDPVSIFKQASADEAAKATKELLERTAGYGNFVISSGCDTPPGVPLENIDAFYDAIKQFNNN